MESTIARRSHINKQGSRIERCGGVVTIPYPTRQWKKCGNLGRTSEFERAAESIHLEKAMGEEDGEEGRSHEALSTHRSLMPPPHLVGPTICPTRLRWSQTTIMASNTSARPESHDIRCGFTTSTLPAPSLLRPPKNPWFHDIVPPRLAGRQTCQTLNYVPHHLRRSWILQHRILMSTLQLGTRTRWKNKHMFDTNHRYIQFGCPAPLSPSLCGHNSLYYRLGKRRTCWSTKDCLLQGDKKLYWLPVSPQHLPLDLIGPLSMIPSSYLCPLFSRLSIMHVYHIDASCRAHSPKVLELFHCWIDK